MNATIDNEETDLRYAEYALGVLAAAERAAVEQEARGSEAASHAVEYWQRLLAPMGQDIAELMPAADVWERIQNALKREPRVDHRAATPARRPAGTGLWDSLFWWRGLSLAAAAAVIALLAILLAPQRLAAPYLTATLQQGNGTAGWTVTVDMQGGRAILVPATPAALPAGRSPELWLIAPGGRAQAVGVFSRDAATTLRLNASLLSQLARTAAFAVSIEPPGGSPTGAPTGPVIAQGTVRGS
jgi:anti-sigma-K factor RskA